MFLCVQNNITQWKVNRKPADGRLGHHETSIGTFVYFSTMVGIFH